MAYKNYVIWLNIGDGSHHGPGPGHMGTIRPQYSIQKVATLLWPRVVNYSCNFIKIDIFWNWIVCKTPSIFDNFQLLYSGIVSKNLHFNKMF